MNWRPIRGWRKPLHERGMKAGRCHSDFSLVQDRHPASILSTRSCHLRLNHAPKWGRKGGIWEKSATLLITAQLLLTPTFMSRVAFHESEARNRRKFRIHISLRQKMAC